MSKKILGSIELLIAAIIWGFAFVAQTSGAETIPTFTFNCLRSFIAVAFLALLCFGISLKKPDFLPKTRESRKGLIIGGVCCGVALFTATSFQQYGIGLYPSDAGASGRAGFITALYVVIVPCITALLLRRKVHGLIWLGGLIAVLGMYMICFSEGLGAVYLGDLMVLICSLCFCVQILLIDHFVAKNNGILLSTVQFLTMGVLSLIFMLIFERPSLSAIMQSLLPLLYLGIMSSGVAYTLQIVGQKNTEPAVASIIMSFESVFALIGGWLILGEKLSGTELIGCALVFVAIIVAQAPGFIKKK